MMQYYNSFVIELLQKYYDFVKVAMGCEPLTVNGEQKNTSVHCSQGA